MKSLDQALEDISPKKPSIPIKISLSKKGSYSISSLEDTMADISPLKPISIIKQLKRLNR